MKEGENYVFGFDVERKKTFTLDDVEIKADIKLNVTFIDEQDELKDAKLWLTLTTGEVGVDIETTGLDPHQHDMIMLQFGDKHRQFVIDTRVVDVTEIIPLLINKVTTLVGQNLKFEYKFFKHAFGVSLHNVKDTMIQEVCLRNGYGLRNDLKSLAKRYLNYIADKTIRMRFLTIGQEPFSKDEIVYGALDVVLPILIDEIQQKNIKKKAMEPLVLLEHEYLKVLGDMEYKGMHFDKPAWYVNYLESKGKYALAEEQLDKFLLDGKFVKYFNDQKDLFGEQKRKIWLKWTSSKQVIELFKELEVCPKAISKTSKKMAYTVDAKVIKASLNTTNKGTSKENKALIKSYLTFKELEQRVTTFGEKFFKYINPETSRLHSGYRQIVSTGRSSSSAPNLQNIPAEAAFRKCFTAPKGYKIINADFSGQENIVLANKSLDKDLLFFYRSGNSDMHSFIASKIYNKPYEDYISAKDKKDNDEILTSAEETLLKERGIAKAAGFAINYGGNGHTISKNLGIPAKQGDAVYDAYFKAFSGLRGYFDKTIEKVMELGYIPINEVTNRRLNLLRYNQMVALKGKHDRKKDYLKLKGSISRLALNAPIQGTAADITKNAAVRFRRYIYTEKLEDTVFITNIVHDEINVECEESITKKVAAKLEECMADAGKLWCKTVPLTAKAVIGEYWAH